MVDSKSKTLGHLFDLIDQEDEEAVDPQKLKALNFETRERSKCAGSADYFIRNYCHIFDTSKAKDIPGVAGGRWIPFDLWKEQVEVLELMIENQKIIVLKARQNGLTWLCLAFALWRSIFHPIQTILVYSLRDDEAIAMLGDEKLKGMYRRLPEWLRSPLSQESKHRWTFENGSAIVALPTTAGDSYTATMAIVDEADLIPDLPDLLQRVQPTIDAGGKLILISRSNKRKPKSMFKRIYRAAKELKNDFVSAFIPWFARPQRTPEWYEERKAAALASTGVLDDIYESYPSTDVEALAPSTLDKRFPFDFLNRCWIEDRTPLPDLASRLDIPFHIPGLRIFEMPHRREVYSGGGDPAEGNPTSDDSAFCLLHKSTGRQVAVFNGKHEPGVFAEYIANLCEFYNNAAVLIERNNHGHAVIMALENLRVRLLLGPDEKAGYQSNRRTKVELYDHLAESIKTDDILIVDFETFNQIGSLEGDTLSAPEDENDDLSDAFALADIGRTFKSTMRMQSVIASGKSSGWTYARKKNHR